MQTAKPGIALRNLRKRNHWTLAAVSERTGIPASTLSRIENDHMSPTYDLLNRLSSGLSIDLSQLLTLPAPQPDTLPETASAPPPEQSNRRSINRASDGEVVEMPGHTLRYLSSDLLNKQFTPILSEYRARSLAEFGSFMRHAGEEFLLVLEGELELHTETYAPLILKAGESTYFDSSMGHAYIARGEGMCRALSVCTVTPAPTRIARAEALPASASSTQTAAKKAGPRTRPSPGPTSKRKARSRV